MQLLTTIANEMYTEAKANGQAQRTLKRGLTLTLKMNYDFMPTFIHLSLTRKTNGGSWGDDKAKEEAITRRAFGVPGKASRLEDKQAGDRGNYHVIRYGWHEQVKTMPMFAPPAPWEVEAK